MTLGIILSLLEGLIFGSFLNVVIYRLPRKESIVYPSSHCTNCGNKIRFYDNIPILSYLILKGRCRNCKTEISMQYPLIELTAAIITVIVFIKNGYTLQFVKEFCLIMFLLAAACIDYQHGIIPNKLNSIGAGIGFLFAVTNGFQEIVYSVMGAVTGASLLLLIYYAGKIFYGRDGVGMGDVKLSLVMGIFLGPFWCAASLVLAVVVGGLAGLVLLITRRSIHGLQIPFGPFMAIGGGIVVLLQKSVSASIAWYSSLFIQ